MPPKRKFQRDPGTALPPLQALSIKGWCAAETHGIIFGLAYAGRSYAEVAKVCGVRVSTVSATVAHINAIHEAALEDRRQASEAAANLKKHRGETPLC